MTEYKTLEDIESLLKSHVPGKIIKQELEPLTQSGENYGSVILKADFTIENKEGSKVIHAVAKMIPTDSFALEIFRVQTTFRSEISWYSKVVPTLQEFQKEQGAKKIADYYADFYGGRISLDPNSDKVDSGGIILLENLKISGFSNEDRQQGFDFETTKLILDHLANFHSTSVALKLKKPEVFETDIRPCFTDWQDFHPGDELPQLIQLVIKENSNLKNYVPKLNKLYKKVKNGGTKRQVREPWAGIVHNDFWVNNIMLRHENHNATTVKFVDFQCFDYGSFAKDLIFFLFDSVQTPVQKYHFDKLLKYYYEKYIDNLKDLKVDTTPFTFESFEEELKKEASQVLHSVGFLFVIMAPRGGFMGPPPEPPKEGEKLKMPPFPTPHFYKEKIWTIVEIAARKNWI